MTNDFIFLLNTTIVDNQQSRREMSLHIKTSKSSPKMNSNLLIQVDFVLMFISDNIDETLAMF